MKGFVDPNTAPEYLVISRKINVETYKINIESLHSSYRKVIYGDNEMLHDINTFYITLWVRTIPEYYENISQVNDDLHKAVMYILKNNPDMMLASYIQPVELVVEDTVLTEKVLVIPNDIFN